MQIIATFKGKFLDNIYHWERVEDKTPKQLFTEKSDIIAKILPKVNQQYILYFDRLSNSKLVDIYKIENYYTTCGHWKRVGDDLVFKRGENKGLTVAQYASCFPNNPEEEKRFVKSLIAIYKKRINNPYTCNNIIRIFNEYITYCDIFGYGGSVILSGSYKNTDITKVNKQNYISVRNRLEFFSAQTISPITKENCKRWIQYLDQKYNS